MPSATTTPCFDPDALVRARRAAGLSREKLAADATVSFDQLRRYERGQAIPSLDAACRLAPGLALELSCRAPTPAPPGGNRPPERLAGRPRPTASAAAPAGEPRRRQG